MISRRDFLKQTALGLASTMAFSCFGGGAQGIKQGAEKSAAGADRPNIIIILTDDEGYGDLRPFFPATGVAAPNFERFAAEGVRFSDFYVGASVCSPSRAALMTGCYPQRVGLPVVLEADSKIGLSADEESLPQLLERAGYATCAIGKWHLGDRPEFLPTRHGFQEYFGLPYSNDMGPGHPMKKNFFPDLPLMEGEKIVDYNPDLSHITARYTERAVEFIEGRKGRPFFLYLAHTMPHVPLFVSEKFAGKSGRGLYGDVLLELDWSLGEVMGTLKRLKLDKKTLVIFLSDNGPWLSYGNHAGSAGPLRDGKTTTFDGGQRVPCLMRWPGTIPANRVNREVATAMDLLPTLVKLAGADTPRKAIDGKDIGPLMTMRAGVRSPHEAVYYYNAWQLQGVRWGRWKLVLPHDDYSVVTPGKDGFPGQQAWTSIRMALYDLWNDVGEATDVAGEHPEIVQRLLEYAAAVRADLGDGVQQVMPEKKDYFQSRRVYRMPGKGQRPPGMATTPARSWQAD